MLGLSVPSMESLEFKLTQNLIAESQDSKASIPNPTDSLEYTISRVSIQNHIYFKENLRPQEDLCFAKVASLKTTCGDTTALSQLHQNASANMRFRSRIVSSKKVKHEESLSKRNSLNILVFGNESSNFQQSIIPLHSPFPRSSGTPGRKKSNSTHKHKLTQKINENEVFALQNSLRIRTLSLKDDPKREKNYLRQIILNRSSVVHPLEEFDCKTMNKNKAFHLRA